MRLVSAGRCVRCGKPAVTGRKRCEPCATKARELMSERRRRNRPRQDRRILRAQTLPSYVEAKIQDEGISTAFRELLLINGGLVLVDECDYLWTLKRRWTGRCSSKGGQVYAVSGRLLMHREILTRKLGHCEFQETDHVNGCTLDNRRSNLRPATRSENAYNSKRRSTKTVSRFKNVGRDNRNTNPWFFTITVAGRKHQFGGYATEMEAAVAYNRIAPSLTNNFARLNDVRSEGDSHVDQ